MAVNKVIYNNQTLIDLTADTATAVDVSSGKTFHLADGTFATGTGSGGGQSSYQLIGSKEFTVSTTSTGTSSVGTVSCYPSPWQHKKMVYVRVRDKAGKRAGYFYGSDAFFMCTNEANGSTSAQQNSAKSALRYTTSNTFEINATGTYGVYALTISSNGNVNIYKRYSSSNSLTIDGTYKVEVYLLAWPDNVNPFD